MERIFAGVVRHRKPVVVLFALLALAGVLLHFGVRVNYNLADYLPESASSTDALRAMSEEFGAAIPNARVLLRDVSLSEAMARKAQLRAIEGVSDVLWLDDVLDIQTPLEMADPDTVAAYYKDGAALLSLTIRVGDEIRVVSDIRATLRDGDALSGDAVSRAVVQEMAAVETRNAMLILLPVILLTLLLSTRSWLEPLLFFGAIGASVLISMGLNMVFGSVSFITNAVAPILQMAVSLDYAIFLLHSFDDCRKQTDDPAQAMRQALSRALPAVGASAATTLFGFLALLFMRFEIGSDLGLHLVLGIALSFISVMVFLPALTLLCAPLLDKTKHKKLLPSFQNIGRPIQKARLPMLILAVLLIVPSFLAQNRNNFLYGTGDLDENGPSGRDALVIEEAFGRSNPLVLLLPKGDRGREALLCADLAALPDTTQVISYVTTVGALIPDSFPGEAILGQFDSEHYTRVILYASTAEEGEEAFALVERVRASTEAYYGAEALVGGQSATLYDMKTVVVGDNQTVNFIAIGAIFLVLLLTFRSLTLPFLLLLTIETAIWVNLAVPYFMGDTICYTGFLIVNTVQLGATVDYAILLTDHYRDARRTLPRRGAISRALGETFGSILVSAVILSLSGFSLFVTSSNVIVSEMGLLLFRGTLLSALMVVFLLPALLTLFDGAVRRTTLGARFRPEDGK